MSDLLWQTKLHARLHDPAEKALVLLRDPAGHEGGNSRVLWRMARHDELPAEGTIDNDNADVLHAVAFANGIKPATYKTMQRADWWAAAADRPQWPLQEIPHPKEPGEKALAVASWAQVQWAKKPVLIHPLTGEQFDLSQQGGLSETDIVDIKQRAFTHLSRLIMRDKGGTDFRKTVLAMWRFGAEVTEDDDNGKLGALWDLLPADTRVPDHSIWDHLDLTSAFAGAFAADENGEAALLSMSLGPVQSFIASARKMDDLWAGSHLLARLSWEAMKSVCNQLGPDAILFPRLRGVPQVDLWLRDECELPDALFADCDWNHGSTDSNPLFSAALPNRFVAVVPASQAKAIAERVEANVRAWLQKLGETVVIALLKEAGFAGEEENIEAPYAQMREQLSGFPEVHWAAVPFSLIRCNNMEKQRDLDITQLSDAMKPFFSGDGEPGFLDTPAWKLLSKELDIAENGKKSVFFAPNPGVLYPAVHDLAERVLAAAKATRSFAQVKQDGWRCTLTGETEWLTFDREQLSLPAGQRRSRQDKGFKDGQHQDTLWTRIADAKPAWAKKGEHLGALSAIKRLWPTLFAEEVGRALALKQGDQDKISRFVVSTHTMALAHQLERNKDKPLGPDDAAKVANQDRVALPRKLAKQLLRADQGNLIARIPGWLDAARESDDESELNRAQRAIKDLFGSKAETYYALLLMDGDKMGAILSGDAATGTTITYRESFHPQVQAGFDKHANSQPLIKDYGQKKRALSPNRHLAISGALNDFSLTVVRHVVEEEYLGRLIYAGGDDVFAMLPVADLLPAMQRLRHAYSGHDPDHEGGRHHGLTLQGGFALLSSRKGGKPRGRLMRMMGTKATASCGAVIAHHQAPLSAVRRELAIAEQRAKNEGGRDAFSITVIKRSGGALYLTEKWGEPVKLLTALRGFLVSDGVSRRAVYHALEWLDAQELPVDAAESGLLGATLAYQLNRQAQGKNKDRVPPLADGLARMAKSWLEELRKKMNAKDDPKANANPRRRELTPEEATVERLRNFLSVAEFLARETRTGGGDA